MPVYPRAARNLTRPTRVIHRRVGCERKNEMSILQGWIEVYTYLTDPSKPWIRGSGTLSG